MKLLLVAKTKKLAGLIQDLSANYVLLDKEVVSHRAHRSVIKMIKREAAHVWHCCRSFCTSRPTPDLWSFLAIRHQMLMNETENVCGLPLCCKVLALPVTNCKDLTHLCNWLLVCMCVCMSECEAVCYLLTHVEVVCMFFLFFFSSCSVAWQLSLCFGVPLC